MIRLVAVLLLSSTLSFAQSASVTSQEVSAARLAQLTEDKNWTEIVHLAESAPSPSADLQYYYGLGVFQMEARLGNFQHAEEVLLAGHNSYPRDKRFPTELAGIAFRQKKYSQARRWLGHALKIDSRDAYANDFLATTYFLDGNIDAALKYWNRIDKPHIAEIRYEPQPTLDPILLDRAFAFSPESTLRLDELWTTEARLRALGIFPSTTIELAPRADGQFDTLFRSVERNGFGDGKLQSTLSFFRGVFQQTVYPEYRNANSSAINFTSLYRWDAQRRRVFASLTAPLRHDAKWRYSFNVDLRNENWDIRNSPADTAPVLGAFNLRKATVSAGIASLPNWRWGWSTGVELTHRDFRNVVTGPALTAATIPDGTQFAHLVQLNYELLRSPEHRLTISSDLQAHTGRVLSGPENLFSKLQAHAKLRWLPQPHGDDYEMVTHLTVARGFGDVPFDEMFPLGLDPDSDLFLRAHSVTRDGRKGNSPLSSSYFLSNSEFSKIAYSNGLFSVKVGPFVDIAKIMNSTYTYEGNRWLCDTGLQLRLSALGVGFTFSYGKDLRSGNNLFYLTAR